MTTLAELEVLVVDCQTTGGSPGRARVIELAFARTTAAAAAAGPVVATDLVVRLPSGVPLPRRVTALTGLGREEVAAGLPAAVAWRALEDEARRGATASGGAVGVAHFARFEAGFFEALHAEGGRGGPMPLELLCTHEIARRLLPALPRLGLRALAGYLGHVVDAPKRAGAHVAATAVVWADLVGRLAGEAGVTDLEALRGWLRAPAPPRPRGARGFPLDRAERLALPDAPGVYRMVAKGGAVLYVGKATSLRHRVNSYFQKRRHDAMERTLELLTQARQLSVTVTATSLEAALLEADEIKRLAPPYNKALKSPGGAAWHASPDLASVVAEPDGRHPLGPLPSRAALDPLAALREALGGRGGLHAVRAALALPDGVAVDDDALEKGLALFVDRHRLARGASLPALLVLGARLFRLARARRRDLASADEEAAEDEPAGLEDPRGHGWDPERVAGGLESAVLRGAQLLRRAHLLAALSEAVVAFDASAGPTRRRRLLHIAGARVVLAEDRDPGDPLPVPPNHGRTLVERQRAFDGAAYDRLRVLTTELRRVLAEGGAPAIRLGPGPALGPAAVGRRLGLV